MKTENNGKQKKDVIGVILTLALAAVLAVFVFVVMNY